MNWEGLKDQDGNELECNAENKVLLVENSPYFSSFIADCIEKLTDMELKQKEIVSKNLKTSSQST